MRGLVLGRFLPYHVGHAHLIREARRQVDELVVLVCSIEREPIPGCVRFQWVRTAHPDCRVVHVADANGLLVCDTALHTTCTWSDLILGECREWIRAAAAARRYDAILLLGHDLPWVNDGTRVLELRRAEHTLRLQQELRRAGRTWTLIEGNPVEREAAAIRAIDQVVRARDGSIDDVRVG